MNRLILLAATGALAACSTAPQPTRSAQGEAELQKLLAGKVQGPSVSCIQRTRANDMIVIDDGRVAFRQGGNRVYVNNFGGGSCNRLGSGFYALKTQTSGGGLCRGDIAEVVDIQSGTFVGSCVFGDFVQYNRAGS